MNYLELDDFLMIAQAVTGIDAEKLARLPRMTLAESALASPRAGFGGEDAYPGLAEKAAVLCWHLARNHPRSSTPSSRASAHGPATMPSGSSPGTSTALPQG